MYYTLHVEVSTNIYYFRWYNSLNKQVSQQVHLMSLLNQDQDMKLYSTVCNRLKTCQRNLVENHL